MESIFDLKDIRDKLNLQDWEDDEWNGRQQRSFYLGSVFSLMPSGKYYTPWANSNVSLEEADLDDEWYEKAEDELWTIGCSLESGEGDPCDLFATEYRDIPEEDRDILGG